MKLNEKHMTNRKLSQLLTLMFTTTGADLVRATAAFQTRPGVALIDNPDFLGLCEIISQLYLHNIYDIHEYIAARDAITAQVRGGHCYIVSHLLRSGNIVGVDWDTGRVRNVWTEYRRAWLSEEIERLEACGK